MAQATKIEWTEVTWNPVTGCSKISEGCRHCYAERMAARLKAMGQPRYRNGFRVTLQPDIVELPLKWKKPRVVFVNSMGDLFHSKVPLDYIALVFRTMARSPKHIFQVLTKRAGRAAKLSSSLPWPRNVWLGVTVESARHLDRLEHLRMTPAAVRFISFEPLLGEMPCLELYGIDWVIVGGESGPGARPMNVEWVRDIRDTSVREGVPFFFKQWGGVRKKKRGRILDGKEWNEMPFGYGRGQPQIGEYLQRPASSEPVELQAQRQDA
jgi:protein gp37